MEQSTSFYFSNYKQGNIDCFNHFMFVANFKAFLLILTHFFRFIPFFLVPKQILLDCVDSFRSWIYHVLKACFVFATFLLSNKANLIASSKFQSLVDGIDLFSLANKANLILFVIFDTYLILPYTFFVRMLWWFQLHLF